MDGSVARPAVIENRDSDWGARKTRPPLHTEAWSGYAIVRCPRQERICCGIMGDRMRDVIPAPVPGLDLRREYGHHQSPAIRSGGLIFCSGMVAINPETGQREHGTVTSETRRIFENLKALLASAGPAFERNGKGAAGVFYPTEDHR